MSLLDGPRVIDAASFIAGPVTATILADLGADVHSVEIPRAVGRAAPPRARG